jgi:catechol 2,3-dioxygenase-like lactoylglutathione lyase family enzyme
VIDRFHHLLIQPADYEASLAFYRDTLGWTVTRSWGNDKDDDRGVILSGGAMKVILTHKGVAGFPPGRPHLHLEVHDVDARFKGLTPSMDVVVSPGPTPWGTRWFVVRDPDNNLIAFEEVHGSRR